MRPAEITDATRHVETTANAEVHTTLLSLWLCDGVELPDCADARGEGDKRANRCSGIARSLCGRDHG
jgi:hypothetical protein